ncbi:MAG: thermonuclease family protein [Candidatus Omnitrophota bacterium]
MKIFYGILVCLTLAVPARAADIYRVEKVINGHTLLLSNHKTVRLIGIEASSDAATEFVRQMVEGKGVKLEFDKTREDADGIWLAYVLMIETFLNATLVHAGYAVPVSMPPNTVHDELFNSLYEDAVKNHRGLWKN